MLTETNKYRRSLIEQVVQASLSETLHSVDIITTVKAFIAAGLAYELIVLIDKIDSSTVREYRNLQHLLILTAMKAGSIRLKEHIQTLGNYDASYIANIAITDQLYEEAFAIFKKFEVKLRPLRSFLYTVKIIRERCASIFYSSFYLRFNRILRL